MTRAVGAAVAVVLVATGLIVLVAGSHRSPKRAAAPVGASTSTTLTPQQVAAGAWSSQAGAAFGGPDLTALLTDFVQQDTDWRAGKITTDQFRRAETAHLARLLAIRDAVVALPPLPPDPLAGTLYGDSAQLYAEWARLTIDTADLPAGPARDQLDTVARRVRELGDRVFDRGKAVLDEYLPAPPSDPNVIVEEPPEVPDWVAEGLSAGPPLDVIQGPAAASPPTRQASRPTGPRAVWRGEVATAGAPAPAAVAAGLSALAPAATRASADALAAAVYAVGADPDPSPAAPDRPAAEGREESDRVRLGWLIDAEAARLAELAGLIKAGVVVPTDPDLLGRLVAVGQRLVLETAGLWSADLGAHESGLDPGILRTDAR